MHETSYSEQELAGFYQDILANPFEEASELRVDEKAVRKARNAEDVAIVEALYERFDVDNTASTSTRPYLTIISRLESIVTRLEEAQRISDPDSPNQETQFFPISILTPRECEALVRVSIRSKDMESAEITLDLMKVCCVRCFFINCEFNPIVEDGATHSRPSSHRHSPIIYLRRQCGSSGQHHR